VERFVTCILAGLDPPDCLEGVEQGVHGRVAYVQVGVAPPESGEDRIGVLGPLDQQPEDRQEPIPRENLPAAVTYVLRRFRTVTAEAGIPEATPIHITETGWPTDDQRTENAQAEVLAAVADAVIASDAGIQTCEWFGLRDGLTTAAWSARFGILRDDYTPKARLHRPPAPHRHGIDAVSGPRLFSRNREGKMAAVPAERRDVPARRPS
jgi:hypothetical protein